MSGMYNFRVGWGVCKDESLIAQLPSVSFPVRGPCYLKSIIADS